MAAYTQSTTFLTSIKRVMEIWNNTTNETMIEQIMVLIDTEFAAMETAGLDDYEVSPGLEASMLQRLNLMTNTSRLCMQNFLFFLLIEFAAVETSGLDYTVTDDDLTDGADVTGVVTGMKRSMELWSNSTHRTGFDQIIAIISTELEALEDAS